MVDHLKEEGTYQRPLAQMRAFLDALDAAEPALASDDRALAALGPKMLELARTRTAGVHPYLVTPSTPRSPARPSGRTRSSPTEQGVVLETDPDRARAIARTNLAGVLRTAELHEQLEAPRVH